MSNCGGLMDFFPASFMLQLPNDNGHQTPQDFPEISGIAPMVGKRSMPFSGIEVFQEEEEDNVSDDGLQLGEKKRRLSMEQVKTLEKSFEVGNKIEPERKLQLAKALGLQPRQVAIWFQNRRARWKIKQLEKDYVILKRQFEAIKTDNDSLLNQNHKLQSEISTFKGREKTEQINLNKETDEDSCSNRSESSSDIKLDISKSNRAFFIQAPPPSSSSLYSMNRTRADVHGPRFDHTVREDGFNNMYSAIYDQSGLWPWPEHHNYN